MLGRLSWRREQQLRQRRRQRGDRSTRWFVDDEIALVRALASLIIPSDESGPGAHEAEVPDRLDAMVAASPELQSVYERGLFAVDALARRTHAASFVDLTSKQQLQVLHEVERLFHAMAAPGPLRVRLASATVRLRLAANGSLPAARLFARLVDDVKQVFFTSPVSWGWLGYDGPPMPHGYPDLAPRPLSTGSAR